MEKRAVIPESEEGLQEARTAVGAQIAQPSGQPYDLAQKTRRILFESLAGDNPRGHRILEAQLEALRTEVAGPNPSPLERLLAERVAVTWYQVTLTDGVVANTEMKDAPSLNEFWQRRQVRANQSFLRACKTLAQVRRLLGPNIQVNVAEKQVNVMGIPG